MEWFVNHLPPDRPDRSSADDRWFHPLLVCPACHGNLDLHAETREPMHCGTCDRTYPWFGRIPVLAEQETPDPELRALADAWNRVAPGWRLHLGKPARVLASAEAPLLDAAGGIVLEVGCGDGRLFPSYGVRGLRVIGVDFSAVMLQMAAAASSFPLMLADAHNVPLRDGCIDTVLVPFSTIRYLDYGRFFREAHRLLREGGVLGFTAWNAAYNGPGPMLRHRVAAWKQGRDVARLSEVLVPLRLVGFRVMTMHGVFSAPKWSPLRQRLAVRVRGRMAASLARDIVIVARRT
jgi:SAM-dependent methyltransferase